MVEFDDSKVSYFNVATRRLRLEIKKKTFFEHSEQDNRGTLSRSGCKMYNTSLFEHLPIDEWKFTQNDTIG